MSTEGKQLWLKPDETKFIELAVLSLLDQMQGVSKNEKVNFNPQARKDLKDMLIAGNGLKIKLTKLGFDMRELPPFVEGDEDEFLTK